DAKFACKSKGLAPQLCCKRALSGAFDSATTRVTRGRSTLRFLSLFRILAHRGLLPGDAAANGSHAGMKNFLRALRCAWPYRVRLALSVASALLAAAFWSANIAVIYPVLYILQDRASLQTWVDDKIEQTEKEIKAWKADSDQLSKQYNELSKIPDTSF